MPKVVRKPPSKQTRAEKLINLKAARAAKKRGITKKKHRRKQKKPRRYHKAKPIVVRKRRVTKMAKRRRLTNDLTGGTMDVNPQMYTAHLIMSTADEPKTGTIMLPLCRVGPTTQNKSIVIEILKVYCLLSPFADLDSAAELRKEMTCALSTIDHGITVCGMHHSDCFAYFTKFLHGAFTALGTYGDLTGGNACLTLDLTDGAGHGFLVAQDKIYMQVLSRLCDPELGYATVKIYYRFKKISLIEFIGIIGSSVK